MKRNLLILAVALITCATSCAQKQVDKSIKWVAIEDAYKGTQLKTNQKKVFVDVYTDWCGWCVRMDQTTFQDSIIIKMMNKYFHPVKFNAEGAAKVNLGGTVYTNPNPAQRRSSHQLAVALLGGKMSYPSFVILDENFKAITIVPGCSEARDFEKILWFFYNEDYKRYTFERYSEIYDKTIRPEMLKKLK